MNLISFLSSDANGVSDIYYVRLTNDMWTPANESVLIEEVGNNIPDAIDGLTYSAPPTYNSLYRGFVFDNAYLDPNGAYYVTEPASSYTYYYDRSSFDDIGFVTKISLSENQIFLHEVMLDDYYDPVSGHYTKINLYADRYSLPVVVLSKEQILRYHKDGVSSINACTDQDGKVWIMSHGGTPWISDPELQSGASMKLMIIS